MPATYIHQLPDWPAFQWSLAEIAPMLTEVRHRQGRLIGRMESLGFALRSEATLHSLTEEVLKSSEIEGEILDKHQVRSSIARRLGIDIGATAPTDRNVEGVVAMTLDATQNYVEPLTAERIHGWHAALFPTGQSGLQRITVGAWRTAEADPMQVISGPIGRTRVHYEAPQAPRLPGEMQAFLAWYNANDPLDGVLKAAIAHLWFVTIHPFEDGNGRIARAIADMTLARSEGSAQRFYSMSAQIRTERAAYYAILEKTQKDDLDIMGWLEWFLGCLGRAFERPESVLTGALTKARFWEAHAGEPFNERQRKVLNRLFDGFEGKLTTSKWAAIGKCAQDTALRDIDNLLERGLLTKDPGGGRSTSYSLSGSWAKLSTSAPGTPAS